MSQPLTARRVTAADIAREVGVSRATVGFVLNSTPGQTISEATKKRVLDAARRLGYRPHLAAQALASGRNRVVLLVLPDWPMEFSMSRHVDEASAVLDAAGYSLVTMTRHSGGKARPLWETLQPDVVMGMLPFDQETYEQIRSSGITTVLPHPGTAADVTGPLAGFDQGPRLQVTHLLDKGSRRIVYAATSDPRLVELAAARHALAAQTALSRGIEALPSFSVTADDVASQVRGWVSDGVTGVVAYNDDIAALVVNGALRQGIQVPGDLRVIGHDDSPLASLFIPSLTTVHLDNEGLGQYFAQLALSAAAGEGVPHREHRPQIELVEREST
jgi:DNA-binding LacI/PurR family transcriptional regulator